MALSQITSVLKLLGRRLLGSSWGRGAIIIMKIIKVFCFPKMIFL